MDFDGLSARTASVADWAASAAARAPDPMTVARVGLGAMVFAAGVHKLLDPLSWSAYVVRGSRRCSSSPW